MPFTEPMTIKGILTALSTGKPFSSNEMFAILTKMSSTDVTNSQMAAFIFGLSIRGETTEELLGATQFLRSQMVQVPVPPNCVDIVGTGGDGHHTYNISTAAAFVAAGAGAKVVKHGNKSVSSQSGATDVLAALGIKINISVDKSLDILNDLGICFLWAQLHHPTMKRWSPVRTELGIRTIFNLIGPLCNPGNIKRQVVGVYNKKWIDPIANVLRTLGSEHAWIVTGHDGLDELSTTGPTQVTELRNNHFSRFELRPEDVSFNKADLKSLQGGDPKTNAREMEEILKGKCCPYRDVVLLNAGALLVVAGQAENIVKGVDQARNSIDNGYAFDKLNKLIDRTNH